MTLRVHGMEFSDRVSLPGVRRKDKYEEVSSDWIGGVIKEQQQKSNDRRIHAETERKRQNLGLQCLSVSGEIIHPDQLYLFDADQIDQIYFIGFQDKEGLDFLDRLSHYREGKNDEGSVSGKVTGPDPE